MKKIPTLFEREYANHKVTGIKPNISRCRRHCIADTGRNRIIKGYKRTRE